MMNGSELSEHPVQAETNPDAHERMIIESGEW